MADATPAVQTLPVVSESKVLLSEAPKIWKVPGFLSATECEELIRFAQGQNILPSVTFKGTHPSRTSHTLYLEKGPLVPEIRRRVVDLFGGEVPDSHFESVQLTRYELGQFYRWHHDSLSEDHPDLLKSGQRIATVLVYLNTVSDGSGCTHFYHPKLKVAPETGTAVVFFPSDCETGVPDKLALHEAQPVSETAVKYVLQIWVKQRPFRPKGS